MASKIDELFSRIDEGEQALKRVAKLVERYRQSVLKAAVTGELTRDWRAAQGRANAAEGRKSKAAAARQRVGEPVESGAALLARILKARRATWEHAELAKLKAKGKTPTDDRWKHKYQEPAPPDIADLSELPEGWVWASLEQLSTLITSGSRGWKDHYADRGSLFIRAQNIKHDVLELDDVAYVNLAGVSEGIRTRVAADDLLVTITGANVTKSARVPSQLDDAYVSQHVALVRLVVPSMSRFVFYWVVSPANGRAQLLEAAYGAGKPGLSLEDVKAVVIALPPLNEQAEIVSSIDKVTADSIDAASAAVIEVRRTATLRQSILKAAFSGQLVPQDPDDEPAAKLLERIAAERAAAPTKPRRGRRTRPARS